MGSPYLSRRRFIKSLGLAAAAGVIPMKLRGGDAKRPNIVLIYANDLGEKHNLATARADIVKELAALLKRIKDDGRSRP